MNNYELIQVFTKDQIKLNGLFKHGEKTKSACILIHGFTADFYSHDFYHSIAKKINDQGNAIILAQTRGTGLKTEFLKPDGEGVYKGSYYEKLEDAHLDISAFTNFLLKEGYGDIVLMGHSLGTIKSVRYLFEGEFKDKVSKLVLLAPFDKNAFMELKAPGKWTKFLEVAEAKIAEGKGSEIVPVPEYEDFPMSYETFYSWYVQTDLNCIWDFYRKDYDFPALKKINVPTLAIIGEKDEFVNYPSLGVDFKYALEVIKNNISNSQIVSIPDANHTYYGYEDMVSLEVAKFI